MITQKYGVHNQTGLHARPASQFVRLAVKFDSDIQVTCDGKTASAKSIIGILGLGIAQNKVISLAANGPDEDAAMAEMVSFLDGLTD